MRLNTPGSPPVYTFPFGEDRLDHYNLDKQTKEQLLPHGCGPHYPTLPYTHMQITAGSHIDEQMYNSAIFALIERKRKVSLLSLYDQHYTTELQIQMEGRSELLQITCAATQWTNLTCFLHFHFFAPTAFLVLSVDNVCIYPCTLLFYWFYSFFNTYFFVFYNKII